MKRRFTIVLCGLIALGGGTGCKRTSHNPLLGTPDPAVTGVQLYVRGVDNANPPDVMVLLQSVANGSFSMTDLQLANFAVLQGGKPAIATRYGPAPSYPFAVVLVMDRSGSMTAELSPGVTRTQAANDAATLFINSLGANDHVGLVEFDSSVQVTVPLTSDKQAVVSAVNSSVYGGGATAVYDAMAAGAEELAKATGFRLLVVLTDGDDNSSDKTPAQLTANLASVGTVAAGIVVGGDISDTSTMQAIVDSTGGTLSTALDPLTLANDMLAILTSGLFDDIYALTFRRRNVENDLRVYVSYGSLTTSVDLSSIR